MKTFFFDAGLPRSGSTLLSAILNQNPKIYASPLSPVFELMYTIQECFQTSEQVKAYPKPECNFKIISSIPENYYSDTNKPFIIDKSRAWPGHVDLIQKYITSNPKIICTVRNPLNILASFINLIHKNSHQISFIDRSLIKAGILLTDDNRCDYLMSSSGIVFKSINEIAKLFYQQNQSYIHFIPYEELIENPEKEIQKIYNFLDLEQYKHDFNNINNIFRENDHEVYGLSSMHEIKSIISKNDLNYKMILSDYIINKYSNLDFWNNT